MAEYYKLKYIQNGDQQHEKTTYVKLVSSFYFNYIENIMVPWCIYSAV